MLNPFAQAQFLKSCASAHQLPADGLPELAFAGRSNSGKSSALNALTGRRALARVSKTPGRTQLINLFGLPGGGRLADLPGYGYASVPMAVRRDWGELIGGYVEQRANLCGLVMIMDARHPLGDLDRQLLGWIATAGRRCHVLLSKADKLGFGASKRALDETRRTLEQLAPGTTVQLFSSVDHRGVEEARQLLAELLGIVIEPDAAKPEGTPK